MRVEALEMTGGTPPATSRRDLPVSGAVELLAGGAKPEVIVEAHRLDPRQLVGRAQGVADRLRFFARNGITAAVATASDPFERQTPAIGVLSKDDKCCRIAALGAGWRQGQYLDWRWGFW